ncbi:hypothetical protein CDAR_601161 [Caerostris darwini]|uniref:Uncharacterized protein n=1 Tax=Caerostris darwini TaxID=1538125 RepID=A0AAV4QVU9_9ARAC|nr:hypothetical protein CDAR_601161 [Caerostris darwini]
MEIRLNKLPGRAGGRQEIGKSRCGLRQAARNRKKRVKSATTAYLKASPGCRAQPLHPSFHSFNIRVRPGGPTPDLTNSISGCSQRRPTADFTYSVPGCAPAQPYLVFQYSVPVRPGRPTPCFASSVSGCAPAQPAPIFHSSVPRTPRRSLHFVSLFCLLVRPAKALPLIYPLLQHRVRPGAALHLICKILFPGAPQRRPTAYLTSSVSGCARQAYPGFQYSPPRVRPGAALHLVFTLLYRVRPAPSRHLIYQFCSGCAQRQPYAYLTSSVPRVRQLSLLPGYSSVGGALHLIFLFYV